MFKKTLVCLLAALVIGCAVKPQKTSLELQAMQAREFETTKKVAFASVLSVFQDLGYVVQSADLETGFITAKSPTKSSGVFAMTMKDTKATAFVEKYGKDKARVRLNFVDSTEESSAYGMKAAEDVAIEDPRIYQNAFQKIQEAIFIRANTAPE